MRLLLQRILSAEVRVAGQQLAVVSNGLLIFVGIGKQDLHSTIEKACMKVLRLRLFSTDRDFEKSVSEIAGDLLLIPQFTLYGSILKGRRPDFSQAMAPQSARIYFANLVEAFRTYHHGRVACGEFAAHMEISSCNDGPVTLLLEL